LLRGYVAGSAELVNGDHSALKLQTDSEIPQGGPAVGKKENVARRNITVHQTMVMGIG
jgi:hypothetical protein